MSRAENDAWEAAQVRVRDLEAHLEALAAQSAGLELQRDRVAARVEALRRKRRAHRTRLDRRPGSALVSLAGVCVGAVLARLGWELRGLLTAEARVALAAVALATAVALFVSRTHGFRAGWRR